MRPIFPYRVSNLELWARYCAAQRASLEVYEAGAQLLCDTPGYWLDRGWPALLAALEAAARVQS
jgi:hypothetical protein